MFNLNEEVLARSKQEFEQVANLCHKSCLLRALEQELISEQQYHQFVLEKYVANINVKSPFN